MLVIVRYNGVQETVAVDIRHDQAADFALSVQRARENETAIGILMQNIEVLSDRLEARASYDEIDPCVTIDVGSGKKSWCRHLGQRKCCLGCESSGTLQQHA